MSNSINNISKIRGEKDANPTIDDATQADKLRQCMYKRIAQGYALVDIEDNARREWHKG